jgi:hypothetical protein
VVIKDDVESPEACTLQLRSLLKAGPREGDHGAANLAEAAVKKLAAFLPSSAPQATAAKQLIVDLRGFFLSPRPFSQDTVALNRRHLNRRIKMLHQAVVRHGLQSDLSQGAGGAKEPPAAESHAAVDRKG